MVLVVEGMLDLQVQVRRDPRLKLAASSEGVPSRRLAWLASCSQSSLSLGQLDVEYS